jgi:membrane protease YdiL (CAAX protease family)
MIMSKKLTVFIVVTYSFSWVIWYPLLANRQWDAGLPILPGQFYYASFGPFIGTVCATLYTGGLKSLQNWVIRSFSFQFPIRWLGIALGLTLFYGICAVIAHRLFMDVWPDWSTFGLTQKLPNMNVWFTALIWILTFGLGEESGWRGFLLPELYKRHTLLYSAWVVSIIWMLWHLPAFWFNENYMNMGFGIIGWCISLSFGSVLLSWLSKGSNFSILPVLLWHGGFDLLTASDQSAEVMAMVCSMLVILHGIYLSRKMARYKVEM